VEGNRSGRVDTEARCRRVHEPAQSDATYIRLRRPAPEEGYSEMGYYSREFRGTYCRFPPDCELGGIRCSTGRARTSDGSSIQPYYGGWFQGYTNYIHIYSTRP
jgi:hypothetical protein